MTPRNPLAGIPLRAARWSAHHPGRAIGAWFAFVLVAVGLAIAVPTTQTDDADYGIGESGRADQIVRDAGMDPLPAEDVLITAGHGAVPDKNAAEATAAEIVGAMSKLPRVVEVGAPQWSPNGKALMVDVQLARGTDDVSALQKVTDRAQRAHPELEVRQAGDVSIDGGIGDRVGQDLSSAEGISLPVTLLLMLLAFGALIAAGIPVLIAASSVAATIGITAPLSHLVHAEPTVSSMIVLIGMAVGVDYSLFYLKREREEREKGRGTVDAVEIAARTSGHSIVVSGLAVIASMTGLYVVGGATFNSLATGSILVVAIAVLGSITVLPALLSRLGRWVDRPRVPLLWRLNRRIGRGGISRHVVGPVVRHPVGALIAGGLVVAALAAPALGMKVHQSNLDTLPADIPQVQTFRTIAADFPSEGAKLAVVVEAPAASRAEVRRALLGLERSAIQGPDFVSGLPDSLEVSADGRVSVLHLLTRYDESDARAGAALEHLRADLVPPALDGLDRTGVVHAVGGSVAADQDYDHHLSRFLPIVVGFVLLLTMLMMGLAFRSAVVGLVSVVLNLGSVGVAFGLLTLVFQHGWFEGALHFSSPGFVIDWLPMFILVVLVGLSMDYHVFVLGRVREHVRNGLPARLAVERGVTDTAGVVTSAAAVMVSVFAIFATLSMLEMKMMGVGLAAAILLDATIIRLVLLPAILALLGDRVWGRGTRRPEGEAVVESDPAYQLV